MSKQGSVKISVVGVGHVGSVVGFTLATHGLAGEVVLCARDGEDEAARLSQQRAAMDALDIKHAIAVTSHRLEVRAGASADTRGSDIVVMTASEAMGTGVKSRMDLAATNTALMGQLVPRLADLSPDAIFVNVTNPVDLITHHIHQLSGFDWRRVIGTGTLIDTFRLRRRLADELDINAQDLKIYVIGEHGDTSLVTSSGARVGGMSLARIVDVLGVRNAMVAEAEEEARNIGTEMVHVRGYTNYGVAMAVEMIVDNIVNDRSSVLPVSVLAEDVCGVGGDVFLSLPCVICREGVQQRLMPELDEEERMLLRRSAATVRDAIRRTEPLLSSLVRMGVAGLQAPLATCGCRPPAVSVVSRRDLATLDRLLRLMGQRLALMHEVARWKWNAGQAITDPDRERELLQSVVERGRGKGLDPDLVRAFFAAQLEAARLMEQADFERWKANKQKPFAGTTSLAVLRQQIDQLNRQLIDALARDGPWLFERDVQQALPQRAEEILTGNGLAGVRETAIAPLRR